MLTTEFYVVAGKLGHDHGSASNTGWVFARDGKNSSRLVIAKNTIGASGDHTSIVEIPESFYAAARRHPNAWAILRANMCNGGSEIGPAETICALVSDCDSWDTVTETGGGNVWLPLSVLDPKDGDRVAYVPSVGADRCLPAGAE